MQQAIFTIKSKQEGTDNPRLTRVTKSTNNAIGRTDLFYLNRAVRSPEA